MYTPKNSNHLRSHSKQIRPIFLRSTSLLYKILPTNLGLCKPTLKFILFMHHIRGETVLWGAVFIIQTSDRMQYFTIFQDKFHSVNIQDVQSWAFSETVQKISKINNTAGRFSILTSAKLATCGRVVEWTLIKLPFNIIQNLFRLFFYLLVL